MSIQASALTGAPIDREANKLDLENATSEQLRWLEYMSLENQVSEKNTTCFVWHTAPDDAVPVENAYAFASACHAQGINCALHIFLKDLMACL
jgi:dipeptidyl aminopeptidase/acylaminoacyl peptidase